MSIGESTRVAVLVTKFADALIVTDVEAVTLAAFTVNVAEACP